ncbi:MAG: phenylalanine--tRNA ligase subunit alpha [Candidatus Moranbacteria bacterium]|nr:phenylalanine--tRNA ligase subunit alpha [Candidatus Moranbacteria bacterium]
MMKERILQIGKTGEESLPAITTMAGLQAWEVEYLGRKSELNTLLKSLRDLSPEEKKIVGPLGNSTKQKLIALFDTKKKKLLENSIDWQAEGVDITAPGAKVAIGHLNPLTQIEHEIQDIFTSMGFVVADGPEVETEHYNFDALNFPKDHPSRDMQDTFWIKPDKKAKERYLPRTHTSGVQVRYMEAHKPPLRIIVPGKVFRNEATDASHEHTFHQFECLMVDVEGQVTVATFKYVAETFFSAFFGEKVTVRLRPSFFPFTEPSFEFDISCIICGAHGCATCKHSGWLEIGGAGMVNQRVFEAAGYKRGQYQGFAWGFGMARLAMMKYKIADIRLLMSGDLRFIRQF